MRLHHRVRLIGRRVGRIELDRRGGERAGKIADGRIGRAAEARSGRQPAGLYACDSGEGRHRGRAQGKQGPGVRTVRRGGAARRAVIDAGVEDQGAADRQAALPVGVATANMAVDTDSATTFSTPR